MVIKDPFDPKLDRSTPEGEVEAAKRMNDYTAALEDFKLQDLDGGEKLNWLIDNYAINDIEKAFNLGHGDRQGKTITTDLGGYLPGMKYHQKDWQVRKYINDIESGNDVVFQDINGNQVKATPTEDGNYMYKKEKISGDELGSRMGLPGYSYSGGSGDGDSGIVDSDLAGERENVRGKLQAKLGDDYTIEVNDYGARNDIMIYHNTVKGEKGNKLSIGFNIGDEDAMKKLNRLINKANTEVTLPTEG
jgi:hypothetical protein